MGDRAKKVKVPHYKIATWNVRGLSSTSKQYKIHTYLKRKGIHIAMLQETHMSQDGLDRISRNGVDLFMARRLHPLPRGF